MLCDGRKSRANENKPRTEDVRPKRTAVSATSTCDNVETVIQTGFTGRPVQDQGKVESLTPADLSEHLWREKGLVEALGPE